MDYICWEIHPTLQLVDRWLRVCEADVSLLNLDGLFPDGSTDGLI